MKRLIDLAVSIILLPVVLLTFLVVKLINFLKHRDNALFVQSRVGYLNKEFIVYKYKTMTDSRSDEGNNAFTGGIDMRITKFGKFLRATKIDELPQIYNIIKGEMSLVGPRPVMRTPYFLDYPKHVQEKIYRVKPGVTGIGSVVFRDEGSIIDEVKSRSGDVKDYFSKYINPYKGELELWYQDNVSTWTDIKIIFFTFWCILFPSSELVHKSFKGLPKRPKQLKYDFDRIASFRESITLGLIGLIALIPIIQPSFWFMNNGQYIATAFLMFSCYLYLTVSKERYRILAHHLDIFWLLFIITAIVSLFFAQDPTLGIRPLFTWVQVILWTILFRAICQRKIIKRVIPVLLIAIFTFMIFYQFYALYQNVALDYNWNYFFGKNANYTILFTVCLYPFLLFHNSKRPVFHVIQLIGSIALLYLILYVGARGALLVFLLLAIIRFAHLIRIYNNRKYILFAIIGIILLLSVVVIDTSQNVFAVYQLEQSSRFYMIRSSIKQWMLNPIFGVGLGNWHLAAYLDSVEFIAQFSNPDQIVRYRSHNLITGLLSEVGLAGLLFFLAPMVYVIFRNVNSLLIPANSNCASVTSLLAYLVVSLFYSSANNFEYHFSAVVFLGFANYAMLTASGINSYRVKRKYLIGLTIISFSVLAFNIEHKVFYNRFLKAKEVVRNGNVERGIDILNYLYVPWYRTSFDYRVLIPHEIGKLLVSKGSSAEAIAYFEKCIVIAPNHEEVKLDLAELLISQQEFDRAKVLIDSVLSVQPNLKRAQKLKNMLL